MKFRNFISLLIALSFVILAISGLLSFFMDYSRKLATIHTVFGYLFILGIAFHIYNNRKNLMAYILKKDK